MEDQLCRCYIAVFSSSGADPGFWKGGFKIEGQARIEGAKRPRIEGEARSEGEARDEAGEGSGEGAR